MDNKRPNIQLSRDSMHLEDTEIDWQSRHGTYMKTKAYMKTKKVRVVTSNKTNFKSNTEVKVIHYDKMVNSSR